MAYIDLQGLIDRFGETEIVQLADRDGDGVADGDTIDRVVADAGALIDGYLAKRYALPLAQTPALVAQLAADVARYFLYDDPTEAVRQRYTDAVRTLKGIADGTLRLDVAGAEPEAADNRVQTSGPDRVFTRDTLEGF